MAVAAPAVALLAPTGLPGALGGGSAAFAGVRVYGETLQGVVLVAFLTALVGQLWLVLDWWEVGRRGTRAGVIASALALLAGVVWLGWLSGSALMWGISPGELGAPVWTTVLLSAGALVAQTIGATKGGASRARSRAHAHRLETLPRERREHLLEEREHVLVDLVSRGLVDDETAARARELPLGQWWRLDEEVVDPGSVGAPDRGGDAEVDPDSALGMAQEATAEKWVRWGHLEVAQLRETSFGRRWFGWILMGAVKGLGLIAPFAAVLGPFGNPGYGGTGRAQSALQSDGLEGGLLAGVALYCFVLAVIGQAWLLWSWWSSGRRRAHGAIAWSALAAVSSALVLVWFPSLLHESDIEPYRALAVATLVLALVVLVALTLASTPGDAHDEHLRSEAGLLRTLAPEEQRVVLADRRLVVAALREKQLVDDDGALRALTTPLGSWWTLDTGPGGTAPEADPA